MPPTQASDRDQDSDTEDLEEVTALTLTKPGGRKRKSPGTKQHNPPPTTAATAAVQKPKSKSARLMDQGDSPNLESASSQVTDEPCEEETKGGTTVQRKVAASLTGSVRTRRKGGRKMKVREREEKEEEEEGEEEERKEDNVVEKNQVRGDLSG